MSLLSKSAGKRIISSEKRLINSENQISEKDKNEAGGSGVSTGVDQSKETDKQANAKVCPEHRYKTCSKGKECHLSHPKKCGVILKHGLRQFNVNGCDKSCGYYHPRICHSSMKYDNCTKKNCKKAHLPGTWSGSKQSNSNSGKNTQKHQKQNGNEKVSREEKECCKHKASMQTSNETKKKDIPSLSETMLQGFQMIQNTMTMLIQAQNDLNQRLSSRSILQA